MGANEFTSLTVFVRRARSLPTVQHNRRRHGTRLADAANIEERPGHTESRCSEEIKPRTKFPKTCTHDCCCADDQIAHQIIRADHLSASFRLAVADDECFARRVAKFL